MGKDKSLTMPYPLILASTSKYRMNLLSQLGRPFTSCAPDIDEAPFKKLGLSPQELALKLSLLKAQDVSKKNPNTCVIGSDQVCSLNSKIFSKPNNFEGAKAQLAELQGNSHELLTAVTIISPIKTFSFIVPTTLFMRKLSPQEIEDYLMIDSPFDCAGSYKLESAGIKLFQKIEMQDHTAIIGLPLIELNNALIDLGYPL